MKSGMRFPILLLTFALFAAACSSDSDGAATTTTDGAGGETTAASSDGDAAPPTTPASITAEDQTSDGSTIVVASITLPAPGFIAVHGDAGGSPGPVIGHSDLLPAGESTDVSITLDEALTASGPVFPMAHIDINDNGVYEFNPPDETTDSPATTEAGDVAVVPAQITVG